MTMGDEEPDLDAGPENRGKRMPVSRFKVSTAATAAASLATVLVTATGCSSDPPTVLNQTRPPVTVTVTTTVTAPATNPPVLSATTSTGQPTTSGTPRVSTASGLLSSQNTPPAASPTGTRSPGTPGDAATAKLLAEYQALVARIAAIDALPRTGAAAGAALDDLAARYRALRTEPVPAKVDPPSYVGRLFSLELFAAAAADEARAGSAQAAARYDVIRAQTATLLALVNSGLGTALALPPPTASPPSPTTPNRASP